MSNRPLIIAYDREFYARMLGRAGRRIQSFSCKTDLDFLAAGYDVDVWDENDALCGAENVPFELYIENEVDGTREKLFPGYLEKIRKSVKVGTSTTILSGTDRLGSLVDCPIVGKQTVWTKALFSTIVKQICAPFGIGVNTNILKDDPIIDRFVASFGEKAYNAINRLCESTATLPIGTSDGDVMLGYASDLNSSYSNFATVPLTPRNIVAMEHVQDYTQLRSEYIGVGQAHGSGKRWGEAVVASTIRAEDVGVKRYRPELVVASTRAEKKVLRQSVNWEAQVRRGRAVEAVATVRGFFEKADRYSKQLSRLWRKNTIVDVDYPRYNLKQKMLIAAVDMNISEAGELTTLTLRDPIVYSANPATTTGETL